MRTPMIEARAADGDDMDGRLVDGWFHTGDLGRIDDEGFLWIEGRVSDMINRGGLKVFPEEVAEVIRLSPDVAECAVAGIPDDRLGEVPWAFVVPREGTAIDADALADAVPGAPGAVQGAGPLRAHRRVARATRSGRCSCASWSRSGPGGDHLVRSRQGRGVRRTDRDRAPAAGRGGRAGGDPAHRRRAVRSTSAAVTAD